MSAEILERIDRLEALIRELHATIEGNVTPFVRGDNAAAKVAGFKNRDSFLKWAESVGIRPQRRGGIKLWDRSRLELK